MAAAGLTDGLPKAVGAGNKTLARSSPTLWNIGYHKEFYWDGRSKSLEAQAKAAWQGGNMGAKDHEAEIIAKINADVNKALDYTQRWVTTLFQAGKEAAAAGMDLKAAMAHTRKSMDPVFGHVFIYEHCLPFDVSRAYDEAKGIKNPRIWTAERDKEMWAALQA